MQIKNRIKPRKVLLALLLGALTLALSACGGAGGSKESPSPAPEGSPAAEPVRRDGERFEAVIVLEGMEETVRCEHLRNETIGIEMDYDYESFVRRSEPDRECFVSIYDDPAHPENYLEVTYSTEDADTVAASIGAALSAEYEIITGTYPLDRAGGCIRIDASDALGDRGTPDQLQMVYIVPAADGSRILTAHYAFEAAEGFGRRFAYLANTLTVIDRRAVEG